MRRPTEQPAAGRVALGAIRKLPFAARARARSLQDTLQPVAATMARPHEHQPDRQVPPRPPSHSPHARPRAGRALPDWRPALKSVRPQVILFSFCCLVGLQAPATASRLPLTLGGRLVKSIQPHAQFGPATPQLNPPDTLIRPIECRNAHNHSEAGICMFSIDCMQNKGVPLSICKHNYFVGTCCKLPDYNNFVGIVYDLRETETSGATAFEARRDSLHVLKSQPPAAKQATVAERLLQQVPSTVLPAQGWLALAGADADTHPAHNSGGPSSSAGPTTERPLDGNKYLISSTKLLALASGSSPPPPTPSALFKSAASSSTTLASESARNADGAAAQQAPQAQIAFASLGEQRERNSTGDVYELLMAGPKQSASQKGEPQPPPSSSASEQLQLASQQTLVISSAHSPAASSGGSNSIYLLADESDTANSQGAPGNQRLSTATVLSNSHQQAQSTTSGSATSLPPASSPLSDQEFTLSTGGQDSPSSVAEAVSAATPNPASTLAMASSSEPAQAHETSSVAVVLATSAQTVRPSESPFVDLVSAPVGGAPSSAASAAWPSTFETTTPFTSSLSTAILPNISSHSFAPTTTTPAPATAPTSALTSSTSSASTSASSLPEMLVSAVSSSSTPATSASEPQASSAVGSFDGLATPTGPPQSTLGPASATPPATPSDMKTNSHPRPASASSAAVATVASNSHHHHHQAASKIVAGNSAANNLIPGLSGLQSAILAHIPFKIASGLSSGLSSYLQAAMKPPGSQPAGRPLISSNTAPALQYQKLQQNQTTGSAQGVRFPAPTIAPTSSSTESASSQVSAAATPRDVVKEAQLVCGRPQVQPADQSKANKRVARIVGGNQSAFGQWPWMVSLRQWRKGAFLHKCGAALVNENWAITAAHCVENVKAADLLLRLGEFDVSNQNEPFPYIERRVKTVVAHPNFDPKTFEYDLALLKFTEPIRYERNIIPVCVPQGNDSYVDRMATVIGWGRLFEDGPLPDVIQHVDVPIITNQECERMYKNAGFVEEIPEMFICAGINKGGRDSCEGDSGGPLTMVDHDGRSYLVGIISWGIGCALPSQPGVYTRITAFSAWINQIIAS